MENKNEHFDLEKYEKKTTTEQKLNKIIKLLTLNSCILGAILFVSVIFIISL